jgi:hypothetical protein
MFYTICRHDEYFGDEPLYLVVDGDGWFAGHLRNTTSYKYVSGCTPNPVAEPSQVFSRVYEGMGGSIFHLESGVNHPAFVSSWAGLYVNPDLLPDGTKNVYHDFSDSAIRMALKLGYRVKGLT